MNKLEERFYDLIQESYDSDYDTSFQEIDEMVLQNNCAKEAKDIAIEFAWYVINVEKGNVDNMFNEFIEKKYD